MKQPIHRLPNRAPVRQRSAARSGVEIAKDLLRAEFEKQRLRRELDRLNRQVARAQASYSSNAERAVFCCSRILDDDLLGDGQ